MNHNGVDSDVNVIAYGDSTKHFGSLSQVDVVANYWALRCVDGCITALVASHTSADEHAWTDDAVFADNWAGVNDDSAAAVPEGGPFADCRTWWNPGSCQDPPCDG